MSKAFAKVVEWLHAKRHFNAGMLSEKEPRALVEETFNVLQTPLKDLSISREIPPELTAALEENVFIFSGFKTYHELKEASMLLKDENGGFKPFDRFRQDVEAIDSTYNRNYLAAEYEFAVASSQMAVKWKDLEKDGDRYDLQYRTAGDDRVRPEHAALNGITLPPSDKFWDEYYPPNGWRCRCTAVQVRRGKYPESDPTEAAKAGERATTQIGKDGTNKGKIFRFNPGKQEKIFPPKHPYLPKSCSTCPFGGTDTFSNTNRRNCGSCEERERVMGNRRSNTSRRPSHEEKQAIRNDYENFVRTLPEVQDGDNVSHRKDIMTNNGDTVRVSRKFFSETFAKAHNDMNLRNTLSLAMNFEQWMPNLSTYTTEHGIHHDCEFAVFTFQFNDIRAEMKAMINDGYFKAYTLKIL